MKTKMFTVLGSILVSSCLFAQDQLNPIKNKPNLKHKLLVQLTSPKMYEKHILVSTYLLDQKG